MSDQQPDAVPADGAREEAARQAVMLAFSVVSVLLAVAAQRAAGDPDFYRTIRMRVTKGAERFLAMTAARAWRAAEAARLAYERESA